VNLFPNKAPIPSSLIEVAQRVQSLQFANKTAEDLKLMCRFDQVAALMNALEALPGGNPLKDNDAYKQVKQQKYIVVPKIVSITRPNHVGTLDGSDFSRETINGRAEEGYNQTKKALLEGDNVRSVAVTMRRPRPPHPPFRIGHRKRRVLAEDTVLIEPVSYVKFPFHREITGIGAKNTRIGIGRCDNPAKIPSVYGQIPVTA
jgi:hypothetical protein